MTTSESIKNIATALATAQSEFNGITKDASNPFFKSKYATLDQIIGTVKPTLAKNGLSITQGNQITSTSEVVVTTLLMHISGEWIRSNLSMPVVKNDPQGYGSAITYGRRYAYSAILGVATEDDDDGNSASQNKTTQKAPRQQSPAPNKPEASTQAPCPSCHAPSGKPHASTCTLNK